MEEDLYKGGNPDSRDAYFSEDISGPEEEDVCVDNFVWTREKSNQNLKDPRTGKGFSFYYARLVFSDDDYCNVYNEQNPENIKSLGVVYQKVVTVVNFQFENDTIRIISAWEEEEDSTLSNIYWNEKKKKHRPKVKRESIVNRIRPSKFTSEEDKNVVFDYVTKKFQNRLFESIFKESHLVGTK